ncbi:ipla-3 [Pristionchus pacificus]|uniref:phospholipase A2 n=1 Tax=Pristionchus pacificus TaxID=54126 RepID=A0A2A6CUC4_PRIPA|nr:ipla-3 [Pristionchus pacificus]|eukprot:PDM81657.1 ipla-2 [Pristionchus pacificus]
MESHPIIGSSSADDLMREYADASEELHGMEGAAKGDPLMSSLISRLDFDRSDDSREGMSEENSTPDDCLQCEKENRESLRDEEIVQTPPPSPTEREAAKAAVSFFSLAQVSTKLGEIWSSARESIFGEDYWIPSDPNEIVFFPQELLRAHTIVYPPEDGTAMIRVVQGSLKNRPGIPLHHVVYTVSEERNAPTYSIFRTSEVEDAVDLCRRCHECAFLFTRLGDRDGPYEFPHGGEATKATSTKKSNKKSDARKHIQELIRKMKAYPLWRMLPIAIACNREDVFTAENLQLMNEGVPGGFKSLVETMTQPEGKCPLHIAIEMHRLKIARRMLEEGCDPGIRDVAGNSALHYASLASVQMIELLWEFESSHCLLNQTNNEGCAPVTLAIRNANPRCLATLMGYGAEMSIRVAGRNALFEVMQSKGKNTDIIKAILDGSPDLLHEKDTSGNTVLHAALSKTSLMGLLYLKATELDLNAKNYAGHAPLHLYALKGEIGLIITIASYRCNVDERDSNGNTALHISVSKKDLKVTRLLLCLGADPNVKNSSGDTPRHLAARLKHNDIFRSLLLCGAARCEISKSGCVSGCVNNVMLTRIKSGSQITDDLNSPRTTSMLNGLEDEEAKLLIDNKIRFHTQDIFYKRLSDRLEELEKKGDKPRNFVNLLSMDGGGIRGLVIIQMMIALEKIMGEPVYPYFDWVAGTSTGALVSTALAQGKSLRECQHIYLRFKDLVFDGWTRPYNSALLEHFMKLQVGEESLAEIKEPRLMISTVKADFFPVKLEFMRNYRLPVSKEENENLGFDDPANMPTWKALRRTSAAPMFFSPVDDKYIDGGIIANNPTLDLLGEVQLYNGTVQYMNRGDEAVEVGVVLSLGTGQIPLTTMDPLHVELTNPISSAFAFKNLSLILVDQVTATEGAPVDRSLSWCNAIGVPFFRLSAPLHKDIGLGTKDDLDIAGMMWDCIEYTTLHKAYLERLCKILKKIGKRVDRDCAFSDGKTRSMQTQTSTPSTPLSSPDPAPPASTQI